MWLSKYQANYGSNDCKFAYSLKKMMAQLKICCDQWAKKECHQKSENMKWLLGNPHSPIVVSSAVTYITDTHTDKTKDYSCDHPTSPHVASDLSNRATSLDICAKHGVAYSLYIIVSLLG